MSLTIEVLNLGDIAGDRSFTVGGTPPGTAVTVPANAFLILDGEAPVLVDAGTRSVEVLERIGMHPRFADDQTLEAQLDRHGISVGDLGMVVMTHLHVDHAGRLDAIPMSTPVVVERRELSFAFSGAQGLAYAPEDLHHILDRLYTPGALRVLDTYLGGPAALAPGLRVEASGGHTEGSVNVLVETDDGVACLCGDVIYEIQGSVVAPELEMLALEPQPSGNHATAAIAERAAIKRSLNSGRFLYPSHEYRGAVVEHGRVVGRVGRSVPGPVLDLGD